MHYLTELLKDKLSHYTTEELAIKLQKYEKYHNIGPSVDDFLLDFVCEPELINNTPVSKSTTSSFEKYYHGNGNDYAFAA